jgi:hypothetical protein
VMGLIDVCSLCSGTGRYDFHHCRQCGGTGIVEDAVDDELFCVICGFSMDTECFGCDAPLCRSCARHNGGTCDACRIRQGLRMTRYWRSTRC